MAAGPLPKLLGPVSGSSPKVPSPFGSQSQASAGPLGKGFFNGLFSRLGYVPRGELTAEQKQVQDLTAQVNGLNSQLSTLQGQLATLQNQLTASENNVSELKREIIYDNSTITNLRAQIATLQNQLSTLNGQLANLQNLLTQDATEIETLKAQLAAANGILLNLQNQVASVMSQLGALLGKEGENLQTIVGDLKNYIGYVTGLVNSLQSEIATMSKQIADLQAKLYALQALVQGEYMRDMAQTLQLGGVNPQKFARVPSSDAQGAANAGGWLPIQVPADEGGPFHAWWGDTFGFASFPYQVPFYDTGDGPLLSAVRNKPFIGRLLGGLGPSFDASIIQGVNPGDFTKVLTFDPGDGLPTSDLSLPNSSVNHTYMPNENQMNSPYTDIFAKLNISVLDSARSDKVFSRVHQYPGARFGHLPTHIDSVDNGSDLGTQRRQLTLKNMLGHPIAGGRVEVVLRSVLGYVISRGTSQPAGTNGIINIQWSGGTPVNTDVWALRNPLTLIHP